eukprot:COSAG06_NODE_27975_length_582_cov_3432.033126_1_plen_28_part_10
MTFNLKTSRNFSSAADHAATPTGFSYFM